MDIRIGFVYSGVSYQHALLLQDKYRSKFVSLSVCRLGETDLSVFHVLFFPRGTDQEMAYACREKIKEFLLSGKMVIALGEITEPWLPGCHWAGVVPEDDGPVVIKKVHPILRGLKPEDLHWHRGATGWCCHGHFVPPPGAEVLVTNLRGDPLLYVDRHSAAPGVIVASSQLDADCHAFWGCSPAEVFLDNLFAWAEEEIVRSKGGGPR
ncbi:hypothetical protein [Desulfothermobacter acidiphilus]|uniref:hypothetical protein n=1 Tax=Desulfothermobacter acidiphilus TaxID=1938353 RepID=UPI003F8AC956